MSHELEQQLIQDFLTEAGELIEQLDHDLVELESADEAGRSELLNSVFRALHTVKGAAGFLKLDTVSHFAHAAEDALNRLRRGEVAVTAEVMDALLSSVDVLRSMTDALAGGNAVPECPDDLISKLHDIAGAASEAATGGPSDESAPDTEASIQTPEEENAGGLQLSDAKRELLPYFIADLHECVDNLKQCVAELKQGESPAALEKLSALAGSVEQTAGFFELPPLNQIAAALKQVVAADGPADVTKLEQVAQGLTEQADALEQGQVASWQPEASSSVAEEPAASQPAKTKEPTAGRSERRAAAMGEQTIRVDVDRLEALLNLVGQLVLTKNRMLGMSREIQTCTLPVHILESVRETSNELDRLTGELQRSVMRTRLQPMAKLFDRYPRVIRDISRATGKQIDLKVAGRDTEVDKTVLELLSDPLVHVLRNSADHGIESPEARAQAGKPAAGVIHLKAEHQGNHVRVEITDDGKGLDRDVIGRKAIEKGLISEEELAGMTDQQVQQLIFAPGFSTAEKLSDLSGRGVGMDVVRTNVVKMNGSVHVRSTPGQGSTVEILIPLTVAILPAMVVGVGDPLYALPLTNIIEIVRPESQMLHSMNGKPVLKIRNTVLPLIDLRKELNHEADRPGRFAVVVASGADRAGLLVDRLIGQQEVVIKPLDEEHAGGPFSGATIREDGGVSLILDIAMLLHERSAEGHTAPLRAA